MSGNAAPRQKAALREARESLYPLSRPPERLRQQAPVPVCHVRASDVCFRHAVRHLYCLGPRRIGELLLELVAVREPSG